MIASGEGLGFDWHFPEDYDSPWLNGLDYIPNPNFDEEAVMRHPRTRVKIGDSETTLEIARQAWLLCIDAKYRPLFASIRSIGTWLS